MALTPVTLANGATPMYADFCIHPNGRWLIVVLELTYPDGSAEPQNRNAIACVDLVKALRGELPEPQLLAQGADFYASPCVSPTGDRLAYFRWSHPQMPWDASEVVEHALREDNNRLQVGNERIVAGGQQSSCCQVSYTPHGSLWWAMDETVGSEDSPRGFGIGTRKPSKALCR